MQINIRSFIFDEDANLFCKPESMADLDMTIESVDPRLGVRQVFALVDEPGEQSGALILSFASIPFPEIP